MALRCVAATGALLGEGPVWVAAEQALYWVDIKAPRLHRFIPASGQTTSWTPPFRIGSIAPRARGGFVAAGDRGFVLIDAAMSEYDVIGSPEDHLPGNRFNDGKLDGTGRFWAGTMDDREEQATGSLYRLDDDLQWSCVDSGYQVSNGPAFNPDGTQLYHTDSASRTIFLFDVDRHGDLHNKRPFARFRQADGHPDGMTVDSEGCLWIAFWDGWCVRRLSPGGLCIATLDVPVQRPTSCAFGGHDLDQLFITSATIGLDDSARAAQPLAGGIFVAQPGVCGFPSPRFAA